MRSSVLSTGLRIFIIVALFSSCAVNRTAPMKKLDASIVPVDFNPQKEVLLVVELPKKNKPERNEKLTQQMNDLLVKYYPYKFEVVSPDDLRGNSRYADVSIYKYAVVNEYMGVEHTQYSSTGVAGASATTTYISFAFFDRANNKTYPGSYKSAWIKTSVEAFANTIKKAKSLP